MDYARWIETAFAEIVRVWSSGEQAQREGVTLRSDVLFSEMDASPQVDRALLEAYPDLRGLDLVRDPWEDDPPSLVLTSLGKRAASIGLERALRPEVRQAANGLRAEEIRFLDQLLRHARNQQQPASCAHPCRTPASHLFSELGPDRSWPETRERAETIVDSLWARGLVGRSAESPATSGQDFLVWPWYAAFLLRQPSDTSKPHGRSWVRLPSLIRPSVQRA